MEALKELSRLAYEYKHKRYPTFPEYAIPPAKYSDKDSNGLTKCIIDYLRYNGHYAVRINTQGQYNEKLQQWTKGKTSRGTADIHACISGKHLSVEVKIRDTQSEHQVKTQTQIEKAGGLYFIARNFQSFYDWYKQFQE